MKKLILGIGMFVSGLILICTDYIVTNVIGAMQNVHLVDGVAVFSLTAIGWLLMLVAVIIGIVGYKEK